MVFTGINSDQPVTVFINQIRVVTKKIKAEFEDKHFCPGEKHIFNPKNDAKVAVQILP